MLTRRDFLEKTLQGVAAGAALGTTELRGAERPAWTKPIGLEIYTVRDLFAKDPAGTLKKVAETGYGEVEVAGFLSPSLAPATLKGYLADAKLANPSGYFDAPKTIEDWKKILEHAHACGHHYVVVGDNPKLDAEGWKRRAELFNECGKLSAQEGIQFCYHNHYHEFAPTDNTTGIDIMLTRCDPKHLKMEMDVFWITYAGVDPLLYFKRYPGRFPLLHIKDFKQAFPTSTSEFPYDNGQNPFAPVGQGRIDWKTIFSHSKQAGVEHIFVEQDRCDGPPLDAIKISFDYLKNLRAN